MRIRHLGFCVLLSALSSCNPRSEKDNNTSKLEAPADPLKHPSLQPFEGRADNFLCVAISYDGTKVAAGTLNTQIEGQPESGKGEIWIWDAIGGQVKSVLHGHQKSVIDICFLKDGQTLVSLSSDSTIRIWDLDTSNQIRSISVSRSGFTHKMCLIPGDKSVIVGTSQHSDKNKSKVPDINRLSLYDLGTGNLVRTFGSHKHPINDISISGDGSLVATATGHAHLWDVSMEN